MELNRNDVVYCDFITVKSTDASYDKDTLILDDWYIKEDKEGENFWTRQKKCAQATLDAWVRGDLNKGYSEIVFPEDRSVGYLNICIRATDVPDDLWEVLAEYGQQSPCIYSGCLPMAHMMMTTYRDTYGCIGRSWEINMVINLKTSSCYKISEVRDTFGPYAAALYLMKIYRGNVTEEISKYDGLAELIERLDKEPDDEADEEDEDE